jgi:hypothetical protein
MCLSFAFFAVKKDFFNTPLGDEVEMKKEQVNLTIACSP